LNKIILIAAGLVLATIALCLVAKVIGDGVGTQSGYVLGFTDVISSIATVVAIIVGIAAISEYGGVLGQGLDFIVMGIVPIALFEIIDMLFHLGLFSSTVVNGVATIYGVREAVIENFSVTVGVASMLYGLLKLRVKSK
jgi:hypothetical protein